MEHLDPSFYDSKTTLVNFSSSLLSHFGVSPFHSTIPAVDELLKNHKKVAVFLFDGAGEWVLKRWPHQDKFIREHQLLTIHSVNPATTVACTTSFLTGRNPIETGWLGWSLQFDSLGFPVDVFPNRNSLTGEKIQGGNIMDETCPVEKLDSLIGKAGHKAKLLFEAPIGDGKGPTTLKEFVSMSSDYFQKENGEFLYSYWKKPDETIHEYGVGSFHVKHDLRTIDKAVRAFVKKNPDVLLFTLADHGLIDVRYRDLAAFPEIENCLRKPLSIEGRTPTFFIKPGMEKRFEDGFRKTFPNFFLMTREEVLKKHYFGEGEINPHALEFIGDYVAVNLTDEVLVDSLTSHGFTIHLGHHAGGRKEEREVLLAAYNR